MRYAGGPLDPELEALNEAVADQLGCELQPWGGHTNHGHNFCGFSDYAWIQWPDVHDQPHPGCRIPYESIEGLTGYVFVAVSTHDQVLRGDSIDAPRTTPSTRRPASAPSRD